LRQWNAGGDEEELIKFAWPHVNKTTAMHGLTSWYSG